MAQTPAAEIGRGLGALATACRADASAAGDRRLTLSGPQGKLDPGDPRAGHEEL